MSASRCTSERLTTAALRSGCALARLQSANGDDIDGKTQHRCELVLEMEKVEQRTAGFEVHEEVDVARGRVLSSGNRTKERSRPAPVLPHKRVNLVASCFDDRPPLTHDEIVPAHSCPAGAPSLRNVSGGFESRPTLSDRRVALRTHSARSPGLTSGASSTVGLGCVSVLPHVGRCARDGAVDTLDRHEVRGCGRRELVVVPPDDTVLGHQIRGNKPWFMSRRSWVREHR